MDCKGKRPNCRENAIDNVIINDIRVAIEIQYAKCSQEPHSNGDINGDYQYYQN